MFSRKDPLKVNCSEDDCKPCAYSNLKTHLIAGQTTLYTQPAVMIVEKRVMIKYTMEKHLETCT